jgi:SNF2 family DNA or RNA helicase
MISVGQRVIIRDALWYVKRVENISGGNLALTVIGLSEPVTDKEAIFIDSIDKIKVLNPKETKIIPDSSPNYKKSLLYLESLRRKVSIYEDKILYGHKAAIDLLNFQLEPALLALKQPRQRILIADAVGLGKTVEAGILLTELIKRGRAKRILVVALKSMLTQFQKELWARFSIPLTRLDSLGIQRVRAKIPSNHNPFYYYDKAIISMDTLKQETEYRVFIENSYWDVIVIDEAHNVAERKHAGRSMRNKLAKLLSERSDTLIMLTATPHDGSRKSFASLMNMLNPTAIVDVDNYTKEDIKGLFIRRFKKDIISEINQSFKKRKVFELPVESSPQEEEAYNYLAELKLMSKARLGSESILFKTVLEKSLFSSPRACIATIENKIKNLEKDEKYLEDIPKLRKFLDILKNIGTENFSKYKKLLEMLTDRKKGINWSKTDKYDRLVIFTERLETMKFLRENLIKDLKMNEKKIAILHGAMSDIEQQKIVEDFGNESSGVQILIATDVASEGINLHFLCHRVIHFDIPWSLMTFQQRNGRIDRYGQKREPEIYYFVTKCQNPKINGDMRILEILIKKDKEAIESIGDPSVFMGKYDEKEEEAFTANFIEKKSKPEEYEKALTENPDPFEAFLSEISNEITAKTPEKKVKEIKSIYNSDYEYFKDALNEIKNKHLTIRFDDNEQFIEIDINDELKEYYRKLPSEITPSDTFILTTNRDKVVEEFEKARRQETTWPKIQLLWDLHPISNWISDKIITNYRRLEAPYLEITALNRDEIIVLMSTSISNKQGNPLIDEWFGVYFKDNQFVDILNFEQFLDKTEINSKKFPNSGIFNIIEQLPDIISLSIDKALEYIETLKKEFNKKFEEKIYDHLEELENLRKKKKQVLESNILQKKYAESRKIKLIEQSYKEIDKIFNEYIDWVEKSLTPEKDAFIKVIAVFGGNNVN